MWKKSTYNYIDNGSEQARSSKNQENLGSSQFEM